jgi:RNA polymerase sigma factor (sigma-70 family)
VPFENLHNEKELLAQIANGERKAFEPLYKHYYAFIKYQVSFYGPTGIPVEILIQNIFVRLWEKREKLAEVDFFRGYLLTMTRNMVFNYLRAQKAQKVFVDLDPATDFPAGNDTEGEVLSRQYTDIMIEAIEKLSEGRRKILKMSMEHDLSLDEIAAELQISRSGVKKQLYAARAFVHEYLWEHGEISLLLFVFLSIFEV